MSCPDAYRVRAKPTLPVPYLVRAAKLRGKTLAVAVVLLSLVVTSRSATVVLAGDALERFSVSPDAALDGLTRLEHAGLIRARRGRGRHAEVTVLDGNGREMTFDD